MYNGNGQPLSKKKQVQLMVALTILAWATQTLRHQWGFGAVVDPSQPAAPVDASPTRPQNENDADQAVSPATANGDEKFVPGSSRFAAGATLEMRGEATVVGEEIKLKQVCRWSEDDKTIFAPVADFTLARFAATPFRSVSIAEIKSTLHDAGVNIAAINFVGPTACTVSRSDAHYDEQSALQQWINAKQGTPPDPAAATAGATAGAPATQPADAWADALSHGVTVSTAATAVTASAKTVVDPKQNHTLRDLVTSDLSTRINVPVDQIQMSFRPQDEKLLALSEPQFHFSLDPLRARNLGEVCWNVTILAEGSSQKVTLNAEARAWQQELIVARPLASQQVIRPEDCIERRTLADTLPAEPLLTRDQLLGQQTSRELKPGMVMSSRMVDPVPLVKPGQFVTVTLTQGGVQIKTVARAVEGGCYGQSVRVKNEATREIFEVTMTGPQTATMDASMPAATPGVATAGTTSN